MKNTLGKTSHYLRADGIRFVGQTSEMERRSYFGLVLGLTEFLNGFVFGFNFSTETFVCLKFVSAEEVFNASAHFYNML